MPMVTANGVDLYYEVHGEGAPVLGIHGSPSSALLWEDAAVRLGRRYRCIVYDRRGYFRSERPDPFDAVDLTDHVQDAAALLEVLSATPAVVIGRSTGGEIALSQAPLELSEADLAGIRQPALIVSAQDSPEALHAINRRLAALLPDAETALVPGGHLIDPVGPAVLDFLSRHWPAQGTSS